MDAATTAAKTILKKERHYAIEASSSATAGSAADDRGLAPSSPRAASGSVGKSMPVSAKKKHLVWDEHAIEEHDLLRGTRMKVSPSNRRAGAPRQNQQPPPPRFSIPRFS